MNSKERVMAVINHQKPDRMPCFGANCMATYEQMEKVQAFWPRAHEDGEAMAKVALASHTILGFDAVRVPFCQTFEARALGAKIKPGKLPGNMEGIPGIDHPPTFKLDDTPVFPDNFLSLRFIPELLKAVRILKKELGDEVPVIAGIIGPFTLAGSLIDTVPLLKATFKAPDKILPWLELGEKAGTTLAKALIDAGADIICCEDMTASPELIAPKTYKELELEFQTKQFDAISVPTILHICGKVDPIVKWMAQTGPDILSLDTKSYPKDIREICDSDVVLLGGVDVATTLFLHGPEEIKQESKRSIADGIQILAPGCAVGPGTPTENLLAMLEVAKAH
jgi:[methyl-Co(III) methanol-specific corrinoid protein]:coenzyme M methyltransferase